MGKLRTMRPDVYRVLLEQIKKYRGKPYEHDDDNRLDAVVIWGNTDQGHTVWEEICFKGDFGAYTRFMEKEHSRFEPMEDEYIVPFNLNEYNLSFMDELVPTSSDTTQKPSLFRRILNFFK
jgi:hypothetical protein